MLTRVLGFAAKHWQSLARRQAEWTSAVRAESTPDTQLGTHSVGKPGSPKIRARPLKAREIEAIAWCTMNDVSEGTPGTRFRDSVG